MVWATLRITIIVMYWEYRGAYKRERGDELLHWWASRLLGTLKVSWEVSNPNHVSIKPGKSTIIMSNHRSYMDIPIIYMTLPGSIRMLTKKELFKVPLWGRGLRAGEFISIDRRNLKQAIKDLERARKKMEDGVVLWIAPEGTRTRTGKLGRFKKGGFIMAIQTGATIIPVGIRGTESAMPARKRYFNLGGKVHVCIGKPIDASDYTEETRDQLIEEIRNTILRLSGETGRNA